MSKLIVTGAGGALGSSVLHRLMNEVGADALVATTTRPDTAAELSQRGIDARVANFAEPATLPDAFRGGEALLLISMPVVGERRRVLHQHAIDAARAAGLRRIVYTSVVGAGNPRNRALVKIDHRWTEEYIQSSGLEWNFARNSQYTEAIIDFALPGAIAQGTWAANQGEGKIAYVSRNDCAAAAAALLAGTGATNTAYTPTGPALLTLEDVASIVRDVTNLPFTITHLTDEETYATFDSLGVPRTSDDLHGSPIPYCSDDMVSFGVAIREGGMSDLTGDVEQLTGRAPVSFRSLVEEAVAAGRLPAAHTSNP